jgi:hypothetical protein
MNSLGKSHAFVTDKFTGFGGVQGVDSNVNAAPKLVVKHVLCGVV